MASTGNLVSIKMIASRLMRNPVMKDMNYEFIVDNAIQVLRILDAPSLYFEKREVLNVSNYRALKPIQIVKVEGVCKLINYLENENYEHYPDYIKDSNESFVNQNNMIPLRVSSGIDNGGGDTYRLNNKYINVDFEEGYIYIVYKMVAVDEECYPLVLDNEILLRCVESYIKYKWFDIMNDIDVISDRKLAKAEQDYMFNIGQADSSLKMPSVDEMQTLVNMTTQVLPNTREWEQRFQLLGQREYMKIH